jgi:hypothetical protein
MKRTFRGKGKRADGRRRTYRSRRGGAVTELEAIIASVPMIPTIVNPNSKFVVVTYWWGRGNLNRNTQRPCPEDITDALKEIFEEELIEEDEEFADIQKRFLTVRDAFRAAGRNATPGQTVDYRKIYDERITYLSNYFKNPQTTEAMKRAIKPYEDKLRGRGEFKDPIKFEVMIENWKKSCAAAGCNYMAVEYPAFAKPGGYQIAINAKPLFIRKSLDVLNGRGAMYIDGDMIINKYPSIFDMPNVDFMARGWNIDPRSAFLVYKDDVCFDPYIFETSGGTMFFANSPASKALLKKWEVTSNKPINKGKADDRILSLIFTSKGYIPYINTIQLPIEYLWLGELYTGTIDPKDMSQSDIYIEHPECLTGEERAGEQASESVSNGRHPERYGPLVENRIECARRGGVFYERIFFPKKEMVSSFAPFLTYMKNARQPQTGKRLFEVIDFDDGYGRYNTIALQNREASKTVRVNIESNADTTLPIGTSIPVILAHLMKGVDVKLGDIGQIPPLTECMVSQKHHSNSADYPTRISVDIAQPMFFSAKNPILIQLLAMCKTLADINVHLEESYIFMSRIRWAFDEV